MSIFRCLILSVILIVLFSGQCYCRRGPAPLGSNGFAIVELFTSEGCSSCPSAEAVLAGIDQEHTPNVYVMEFHVDYWNNLGWKDVFSSREYTLRQQQYANALGLQSTYTPQAIVNGKNELVGSDGSKLHSLINSYLHKQAANKVDIHVAKKGNDLIVKYTVAATAGMMLNIALVQKKATTNVRRGENSGRKLDHINIVRQLKTIDATAEGTMTISLPQGLLPGDCNVIAYCQDKKSLEVTAAAASDIH